MARYSDIISEIELSEPGPQIGAFFDFDGTIIHGYSAVAMIREQVKRGDLSSQEIMELVKALTSFGMGNIGYSAMMVASSQFLRGKSEESFTEFGEELFREQIAKIIYPETRALIKAHQRKGHTVAIISSATPYQVMPTARDLNIENVMCTHLEVEDGKFTGRVVRPTCFGQGKVDAAEKLAKQFDVDLERTYFYSDSDDDIDLLKRVGNPRPLNPNRKLAAHAKRYEWPVRHFTSRSRAGLMDWARSLAATGTLLSSFAAGLQVWALTGSRRNAQNFSLPLFADAVSAVLGLKLNINGEKNLWSNRPCVFVFNHQSMADVIIMASLMRKDFAAVGKKEIRNIPIVGQVMEFGGVIFIDRGDTASAIEAMQPLVETIRRDGKSVVLAPEGTRSVTPKLAPFKKGAFHLAMQAGVPVVPVVIHNAIDVAPKGDIVLRSATVDIDVLPPVDTSQWTAATIDKHVAEVRGMFLETLDQKEEDSAALPQPHVGKKVITSKKPGAKNISSKKTGVKRKPSTKRKAAPNPKTGKKRS